MIVLQFLILAVLLGLSACFSMAEAAVTTLSALRMKKIVVLSPRLGPLFQEWLVNPHRLLSVLMVGNNLVNVGFSSLAAIAAVPLNQVIPRGVVSSMVWFLVTVSLVIFGDIFPKIIGRTYRERVAAGTLPFLSWIAQKFFWVWAPVGWLVRRLAPSLHHAPINPLTVVSLEELQHAVIESEVAGHLSEDASEMFRRALALTQRTAREVAQPLGRMDALALEILDRVNGPELFVDLLVETGRTRVPLMRGGQLLGYLNVMDFLGAVKSGEIPLVKPLIRPLRWVGPETQALHLLEEFRLKGDGIVLVGEPGGAAEGFLTLEDVLEELVGEILDEYDREEVATP